MPMIKDEHTVNLTTSPVLLLPEQIGREYLELQNLDSTNTVLFSIKSDATGGEQLGPGQNYSEGASDEVMWNAIYAKTAAGTATLVVKVS